MMIYNDKLYRKNIVPLVFGCFVFLAFLYNYSSNIHLPIESRIYSSAHIKNQSGFLEKLSSNMTSSPLSDYSPLARYMKIEKELKVALKRAKQQNYKIILWGPSTPEIINYTVNFDECGACEVTYNKREIYDSDTKAVVVYFNRLHQSEKLPEKRRSDQLYVWWSLESPSALKESRGMDLLDTDGIFNLTMTYRRDSDVYDPYGVASWILRNVSQSGTGNWSKDIERLFWQKYGLAIWIVSDCSYVRGAKTRKKLAEDMMKVQFLLDAHGKCFPKSEKIDNIDVIKYYKFYLAFENSKHCKDYITEKLFFNSLTMGTVPVVWGATKDDYEAVLPAGSFIFAEDFESPQKLVEYLNYLDKNDSAYMEYFKWRSMDVENMPEYKRTTRFCNLCRILHGINVDNLFNPRIRELESYIPLFGYPNKTRIAKSISNWFYGNERKDCLQ